MILSATRGIHSLLVAHRGCGTCADDESSSGGCPEEGRRAGGAEIPFGFEEGRSECVEIVGRTRLKA